MAAAAGERAVYCVDKFNAAFESLSACQIVGDCLIDIYICFFHGVPAFAYNKYTKKQNTVLRNVVHARVPQVPSSHIGLPFLQVLLLAFPFPHPFSGKKK